MNSYGLPCAGGGQMKFRNLEWLADFILMFYVFIATDGLLRLHSLGQPLSGLIGKAIFVAAGVAILNWVRKHGDD